MTDAAAVRVTLEEARSRLAMELGEPIEGPGQMTYGSQAAAASQVFEQQRDLALRERARIDLERVDQALAALDQGTYGRCRSCSQQIGAERLAALPWAATCIDCARAGKR